MLVTTDFKELPIAYHGLEFLVDYASMPGFRAKANVAIRESERVFTIDTSLGYGVDSLISGHTIVREKESGGIVSVLRADLPVLVDVYAEPEGIFVGGLCVAMAHDLSDDFGRWYYWRFNASELLRQAMKFAA